MIAQFLIFHLQWNCYCIQWPVVPTDSRSSHIFLQRLRLISGAYMLEININTQNGYNFKQAWIIIHGISILLIFDTVFRYLPVFLTVLQYRVPLNAVILLPLHPVSLMHKNPQRCKITILGMCPVGHKDFFLLWTCISVKLISCSFNVCGSYYGCCFR